MEQTIIFRYTIEELENILLENGFKKFSAKQIYDWIYIKMEINFDNMTNLSKELREFIKKDSHQIYLKI